MVLFLMDERPVAHEARHNAADRGDPRAQYVLGLAHFNADYASKGWVRAYALLTLAHSQGLPQAKDALTQMDLYVPEPQEQQAQSLARSMEKDAARRRAAELAVIELGRGDLDQPTAIAPAPTSPALAALSETEPAGEPASSRVSAPKVASVRDPATSPAPARVADVPAMSTDRPAARARPRGEWRVQLGAFGVPGNAERLSSKVSDNPALAGTERALVPAGRLMQVQAVGFASRSDAQAACRALRREGQACIVTPPRS